MARVLVFGTFDGIHTGHLYFLTQAKKKGRVLTVVIARDETVKQLKQRSPRHGENERKKMIRDTG
ncbi:MAG: adenylyltransferase/cytidyltransferase family protein, partial [Patescibacteria group bacterium]